MDGAMTIMSGSGEWLLLAIVFVAAFSLAFFVYLFLRPAYVSDKAIRQKVSRDGRKGGEAGSKLGKSDKVSLYLEAASGGRQDVLKQKLQEAGFYGRGAATGYYIFKYATVAAAFLVCLIALSIAAPLPLSVDFVASILVSAVFLILPSMYLGKRARRKQLAYRRAFPDFMDMMIVCADAGMSLEASANRVAKDLSTNSPELGLHLEVMNLEMRAGRPMREALHSLARRTGLAEAHTLAVLFQQSEELGTSMTQALRVYSHEMRQRRMLAAEERANALPVKMLIPLGACVFPVILIVVLLPIVVRLMKVMS